MFSGHGVLPLPSIARLCPGFTRFGSGTIYGTLIFSVPFMVLGIFSVLFMVLYIGLGYAWLAWAGLACAGVRWPGAG